MSQVVDNMGRVQMDEQLKGNMSQNDEQLNGNMSQNDERLTSSMPQMMNI
jgi:hypothetical protein